MCVFRDDVNDANERYIYTYTHTHTRIHKTREEEEEEEEDKEDGPASFAPGRGRGRSDIARENRRRFDRVSNTEQQQQRRRRRRRKRRCRRRPEGDSDHAIHLAREKPKPETGPTGVLRAEMRAHERKPGPRPKRIREIREKRDHAKDRTRAETGF